MLHINIQNMKYIKKKEKHYENWHPGYAWAVTKDMWNLMGGV
jgi:hypothetical protein